MSYNPQKMIKFESSSDNLRAKPKITSLYGSNKIKLNSKGLKTTSSLKKKNYT